MEQVDHPAPSTVRQEQESVVSVSHKFCKFLEPCHYSKNSVRLSWGTCVHIHHHRWYVREWSFQTCDAAFTLFHADLWATTWFSSCQVNCSSRSSASNRCKWWCVALLFSNNSWIDHVIRDVDIWKILKSTTPTWTCSAAWESWTSCEPIFLNFKLGTFSLKFAYEQVLQAVPVLQFRPSRTQMSAEHWR